MGRPCTLQSRQYRAVDSSTEPGPSVLQLHNEGVLLLAVHARQLPSLLAAVRGAGVPCLVVGPAIVKQLNSVTTWINFEDNDLS